METRRLQRPSIWQGASRDQGNIDRFSQRATANSELAPRASDGPMKLPSTKVNTRDTSMRPYKSQGEAMRREAMADRNIEGDSPFMRSVRRQA